MWQHNEVVALIVALGGAVFCAVNWRRLRRLQGGAWVLCGYGAMLAGFSLSVLEGFWAPAALNAVEHVCYAAAGLCLCLWLVHVASPPGGAEERT